MPRTDIQKKKGSGIEITKIGQVQSFSDDPINLNTNNEPEISIQSVNPKTSKASENEASSFTDLVKELKLKHDGIIQTSYNNYMFETFI